MGKASFSVGSAVSVGGSAVAGSTVATSGAHTTSTTASYIEDAAGDIDLIAGQIIEVHADEAMRIRFGGTAATALTGHYIPATEARIYYCTHPGKVSIIDVA